MNPEHNRLESDVVQWLRATGYSVPICPAYHEAFPQEKSMLSALYSRTSIYIRTRADRIAVKPHFVFEFELKTGKFCEAFPFVLHIVKSRLGVRCLYIQRNGVADVGFWVRDGIIDCIHVPSRDRGGRHAVTESEFLEWKRDFGIAVPGIPCRKASYRTGNSGDPYVSLKDGVGSCWKNLIVEAEAEARLLPAHEVGSGPLPGRESTDSLR